MKLNGYFVECGERTYQKKDGTEGRSVECMFAIANERDVIRISTWHDKEWCLEHGIQSGAAGEVTVHMGRNDRGYYEQSIWGFKTQAQINAEKAEAQKKEEAVAPLPKTPEMEAAAAEMMARAQAENAGAGDGLPF